MSKCTHDNSCYDYDVNFNKLKDEGCPSDKCPQGWNYNNCQCCVGDWNNAKLNIVKLGDRYVKYTGDNKISTLFEVPCYLGFSKFSDAGASPVSFDRNVTCSPQWCPESNLGSSKTSSFCRHSENYGIKEDDTSGCAYFCNQKNENGIVRKEDPEHWCQGAFANYCADVKTKDSACDAIRNICDDNGNCREKYFCNEGGKCVYLKQGDETEYSDRIYNTLGECQGTCRAMPFTCNEGKCVRGDGIFAGDPTCQGQCKNYEFNGTECAFTKTGGGYKTLEMCQQNSRIPTPKPEPIPPTPKPEPIPPIPKPEPPSPPSPSPLSPERRYGFVGTECIPMKDGDYIDVKCTVKNIFVKNNTMLFVSGGIFLLFIIIIIILLIKKKKM
jgi:hypothetical protein